MTTRAKVLAGAGIFGKYFFGLFLLTLAYIFIFSALTDGASSLIGSLGGKFNNEKALFGILISISFLAIGLSGVLTALLLDRFFSSRATTCVAVIAGMLLIWKSYLFFDLLAQAHIGPEDSVKTLYLYILDTPFIVSFREFLWTPFAPLLLLYLWRKFKNRSRSHALNVSASEQSRSGA